MMQLGWLAVMIAFAATPLYKQWFCPERLANKDYDIWYAAGCRMWTDAELYPRDALAYGEFLYPPAAGACLALITPIGRLGTVAVLVLVNCAAWVAATYLSLYLVCGKQLSRQALIRIAPFTLTTWYVHDNFLLGQPNVLLLAGMLLAFVCLRHNYRALAGVLFGLAAAIKAFPVLAIGYLVYRREWRAGGAMVLTMVVMLVGLPAIIRGPARAIDDLDAWTAGMVLRYDEEGIALRPVKSYEWRNQSLVATCNRLLRRVAVDDRPIEVDGKEAAREPVFVNIANLPFRAINLVIVAAAVCIGLAYIALMPPQQLRTYRTDNLEQAMLLLLLIVASPISWFYYGVWLLFPYTVLAGHVLETERNLLTHRVIVGWWAGSILLINFVFRGEWLREFRAVGWVFFGYMSLFGLMGWLLVRERRAAAAMRLSDPVVPNADVANMRLANAESANTELESINPFQRTEAEPHSQVRQQTA